MLLQTVAEAGRCRTVFDAARSCSALAGFADDVAAVELLFTSLLRASPDRTGRGGPPGTCRCESHAVAATGRPSSAASTTASTSASREINEAVYASVVAERGDAFLPAAALARAGGRRASTPNSFQVHPDRCAPPTTPPAGPAAPSRPTAPTSPQAPFVASPRDPPYTECVELCVWLERTSTYRTTCTSEPERPG